MSNFYKDLATIAVAVGETENSTVRDFFSVLVLTLNALSDSEDKAKFTKDYFSFILEQTKTMRITPEFLTEFVDLKENIIWLSEKYITMTNTNEEE